jgi:predicted O-methyltransferase YrrM
VGEKAGPVAIEHCGLDRQLIGQRYDKACREGDMKDFAPLLRSLAKGRILEIGVRDGASTSALLLGVEEHGGHLTSVDIQDCSGLWTHPQWEFLKTSSRDLEIDPASLDIALIDGDHSPQGFKIDLENCLRWVRPGGFILCHDISPLPNYTHEAAGGDWPSEYVGQYFFQVCQERKLSHFVYPGQWGMGCIFVPVPR